MPTAGDVLTAYTARATELRARRVAEARTVDLLGNVRLLAFVIVLVLLARWITAASLRSMWMTVALAAAAGFAWLVRASNHAKARLQRTDDLTGLADEGAWRVARAWAQLPEREWTPEPPSHPYAVDLDLFGPASLSQLMPPMSAAPGRSTLHRWLSAPAPQADVAARQLAVAELRDNEGFRESLSLAGMRIGVNQRVVDELTRWTAAPGWVSTNQALVAVTVLVPLATLTLLAAQLAGLTARAYWVVPAIGAWLLVGRHARRLSASFAPLAGRANTLRRYADMAALACDRAPRTPLLASIAERMSTPVRADRAIRRLTALADCSELRLSPMLYFIVNSLTLWDFHVVHLLERWQRDAGRHAATWLAALGDLEAVSALATLAHDNPDWAFPELDASATTLEARALGHPLLSADAGVRNDVTVGPPGTVLVVTGSNMAGKSTLLRSIGLNLVLSQAGSAVCAARFRHPPATVYSSMRVQDSLARGVSYFMAELERLKSVVDAADVAGQRHDRAFVYLLDEILHGTNSAERTIAARRVLQHLVDTGAIGAVSTHDLQLVDDPALSAVARHVHFAEQFSGGDGATSMTFDYRLRPGKATSTNALKLLELVGLTRPG